MSILPYFIINSLLPIEMKHYRTVTCCCGLFRTNLSFSLGFVYESRCNYGPRDEEGATQLERTIPSSADDGKHAGCPFDTRPVTCTFSSHVNNMTIVWYQSKTHFIVILACRQFALKCSLFQQNFFFLLKILLFLMDEWYVTRVSSPLHVSCH